MPQTFYGGQAVMEGVMMRGRRCMAVAVRAPDERIVVRREPLSGWRDRWPAADWPGLRGVILLGETLRLGMRALFFSGQVSSGGPLTAPPSDGQLWRSAGGSLLLAASVLFLAPLALIALLDPWLSDLGSTLAEGSLRLALLIGYLTLIGQVPEVRRVFGYHGAEHQTINAFEAGAELSPASVSRFGLLHPRCGTGFLLVVVLVSTVVFTLLGRPPLPLRFASRLLLLPVIAAIAYEYIRLSATLFRYPLGRWLAAPGLWLQRLTTRPPDDSMRAVAIAALQQVLDGERSTLAPTTEDRWIDRPAPRPQLGLTDG